MAWSRPESDCHIHARFTQPKTSAFDYLCILHQMHSCISIRLLMYGCAKGVSIRCRKVVTSQRGSIVCAHPVARSSSEDGNPLRFHAPTFPPSPSVRSVPQNIDFTLSKWVDDNTRRQTTEEREKKGNRAVNDLPRTMHGRDGEAGAGSFGTDFSYIWSHLCSWTYQRCQPKYYDFADLGNVDSIGPVLKCALMWQII